MKIGIISFAHLHAHSYAKACRQLPQVELVGIYDENEKRGKQAADQFQTAYYADLETMLSEEMEAVIVTSENVKHRDHVIAAARAGKHVLCEKPIAVGLEDAREMIEVCRRQKVNLQTAFPVRFNSTVARAKQVLEEGKLGDILAFKGTNPGGESGRLVQR